MTVLSLRTVAATTHFQSRCAMCAGLGGDFFSRSIIRSANHWEVDFEIVKTNRLSYQTKQAFDLAICTMVLTFLPDSQIADAIEKLQSMTSNIARKTSSNDV